jgi:hypothetical protein
MASPGWNKRFLIARSLDSALTAARAQWYTMLRDAQQRRNAKVAQPVEHSTENAGVGGSIPPLGTPFQFLTALNTLGRFGLSALAATLNAPSL